ncbi:protein of unknown function [Cupriavidus taiwanensis]|uniref:Uncharacterized protein n=1 Tax=Cupriavidus taiwanensis TaxID=164546 RepID=A0A375ID24_9BURK|nr:protein of unknown function [Cupriavidus taiwanensis]
MQVVGGSNPLAPTSKINGLQMQVCNPFCFSEPAADLSPTLSPTAIDPAEVGRREKPG